MTRLYVPESTSQTRRSWLHHHAPDRRERYEQKYGRILNAENREHYVYLIFDADVRCLYIGCSVQPQKRWRAHQLNDKVTWPALATSFKKMGPYNFRTARDHERELIERFQPLHNRMFTRAHGWEPHT